MKNTKIFRYHLVIAALLFVTVLALPMTSASFLSWSSKTELFFSNTSQLNEPIQPISEVRNIGIKLRYRPFLPETKIPLLNRLLSFGFKGLFAFIIQVKVHLSVENVPSWCTVSLAPTDVYADLSPEGYEANITLSVSVDKDAPAQPFTLTIKAHTDGYYNPLVGVQESEGVLTAQLMPGYVPLISVETPQSQIKTTTPGKSVVFPIKVTNYANYDTRIRFRITNVPRGWNVQSVPEVIVGSTAQGKENAETVTLTVLPPFTIGWHHEIETFMLEVTPERAYGELIQGSPLYIPLVVENRGFSTPGFEIVFLLIALLTITWFTKRRKF